MMETPVWPGSEYANSRQPEISPHLDIPSSLTVIKDCRSEHDSGYGSNDASEGTRTESQAETVTPANANAKETPARVAHKPTPRPARPPRSFPLTHRKDLFLIDQPPTPDVHSCWLNINGPLSTELAKELRSSAGGASQGASLRLIMLGKLGSEPRPCIVVFCLECQWPRVRKFFEQRMVRDLYRPMFDFYFGPPLKPRACGVDVFAQPTGREYILDPCETLCGLPIKLERKGLDEASIATFGGIIKVEDGAKGVVCFGMTAGHVVPPDAAPGAWSISDELASDHITKFETWPALEHLGVVVDECLVQRESENGKYYDWALCRLSPQYLLPNYLGQERHSSRQPHARPAPELQMVDTTFWTSMDDISVIAVTGSGGPVKGWLSTLPCPILFGPGKEFVMAYTVTFPHHGTIRNGDSGSWVMNESTLDVIGQIVATDELDEAYVIPLADIFEDIKIRLGIESVGLASASSIRSVVAVPGYLTRIGQPALDAIRGNGGLRMGKESPSLRSQLDALRGSRPLIPGSHCDDALPLDFHPIIDGLTPPNAVNDLARIGKAGSDSGYGSHGGNPSTILPSDLQSSTDLSDANPDTEGFAPLAPYFVLDDLWR